MRKAIFLGLIAGTGLAFGTLFSISKLSRKIIYEIDDNPALGLKSEPLPEVALSPLTFKELSDRLGYNGDEERLTEEAQIFSQRISAGYLPSAWKTNCPTIHNPNLCLVLDNYFNEHKKVFSGSRTTRRNTVKIDPKNPAPMQAVDFNFLLPRLPEWSFSKFKEYASNSLKHQPCPRNFSLALAHKLEIHFGTQPEAYEIYRSLNNHALECVQPADSWAEYTLIRAALFEYWQENYKTASEFLKRAINTESQREPSRALFWLIQSLEKSGEHQEATTWRNHLAEEHPISWHSIYNKSQVNIDPMEAFRLRPTYPDLFESSNAMITLRFYWLQTLFELDRKSDSVKRFGEFFVRDLDPSIEPGFAQYIARSFDRNAYHRLQIFTLSRVFSKQPKKMSRETLRLLFPKPFFTELDNNSPDLDTSILLGLARQESGFDPIAQSTADARGLLQILPSTARSISRGIKNEELFDHTRNIEIGAKFLLRMIRTHNGSVEKALAAYNAGPGNVRKWEQRYGAIQNTQLFLDFIPFRETRDYVPSILRNAFWYHALFPDIRSQLTESTTSSELLKNVLSVSRSPSTQK